ncbi:MAG: 1,4-beta-xylanase [Actinophytocola sp.]|nr:1,4-beta-xylanase [Actinophytocola sp.]
MAVVLVAATLYAVLPSATGSPDHMQAPVRVDGPLRDLAGRHLLVGTAVDHAAFTADPVYRDRVGTEFSSVTAENVMKWEVVEPERGVRDYAAADELVAAAKRNGQRVRGHTLVWHSQVPAWLTDGVGSGEITPTELRGILRRHILDEVGHFRGKIYQWDVVNEVIDDEGNLRDTLWLRELGPGYIADAFRWAHQADPRAKLFLNDYNVEGLSPKSDAYHQLARDLLAQRVPVHGFGAQGHYGVQYGFHSTADVVANFRRFEDLGLETAVTEADVRMIMPTDTAKLQAQAQGYGVLLQGCLLSRRCTSFTVWGFTDKYSWVPGFFEGEGAANLLDESFAAKPAYREMQAVLALAGR